MGAVDPQDLKDRKPKIGGVLITPRTQFNVYSLIIKQYHFEVINEEYVRIAIHNFRIALERKNISEFRISKHGDFSDTLPKGKLRELQTQEFVNSKIETIICYGNASTLPEELRTKIIIKNHINEFVRKCDICQKRQIVRAKIHETMLITDTPLDTFDNVSLDIVGKLRTTPDVNNHILTMQDNLSKYCIAVAIPDISATTVAHVIAKPLFPQYETPRAILTDREGSFINNLLRKLSKTFGVKQITTSGHTPQSNRSLERIHAIFMEYIRSYAEAHNNWDQISPFAMFAHITLVQEATNFTLFDIVFGKTARTPSSFADPEKLETYGTYL